jgi:hypothetical protein
MIRGILEVKREKPRVFQVLFLNNDASQEVKVDETEQVDFLRVQEHLWRGESVFITSKNSQKLNIPKDEKKMRRRTNEKKPVAAF